MSDPVVLLSTGDVVGPAGGVTDNSMVLFSGTSGKLVKGNNAVVTAAGLALLDDVNAAAQRVTLGLGTASTANVTTSAIDTTAGRVMKVGDFGLGLPADTDSTPTWPATSLNDCTKASVGFWRTIGSTTDRPPGFTTACTVIFQRRQFTSGSAIQYSQLVIDNGVSGGAMAFRISGGAGTVSAPLWGIWQCLFTSGGVNAVTVDTGSMGYGTGSGGTVTQPTSKATGVTLNKPSGQVTTAGDALAANSAVSFTLTNNKIAANDIPTAVIKSGATAGAYIVQVDAVAAGSCRISIRNMTAGSLLETLVLQFNIEKGAIA